MSTTIDQHTGSTTMGCFIICVDVQADVTLLENDDGTFAFNVNYSYSGHMSGSGQKTVPVDGNTSGKISVGPAELDYGVSNWNLTSSALSLQLTASVSYNGTISLGPDYLFENTAFSGNLATVQKERSDARLAKQIALHDKVVAATSASVEHVYS